LGVGAEVIKRYYNRRLRVVKQKISPVDAGDYRTREWARTIVPCP